MGTQGINGNNQDDPLWKSAWAEANKLDAKDGKKNNWISGSVWNKYAKEHGFENNSKGISITKATNLIYEENKQIASLKIDFSSPKFNMETFEIKGNDEAANEVLEAKKPVEISQLQKKPEDTSAKHSAVNFIKIFKTSKNAEGKTVLNGDTNNDRKLSYDEIKAQVAKTNDQNTLSKIAAQLGVNTRLNDKDNTELPINSIKNYINKSIDLLKEADKNEDMAVSDDELKQFDKNNSNSYSNFTEAGRTVDKKARLYEILGITDGNYKNEQGGIGDCWLLGVGQSLTDNPKVYNKIFKKDEQGVTITFYGIQGKNDKPFSVRVTNQQIQNQHRENMLSKNNGATEGYGSNDPDAIALEMAMPSAIDQWNSNMKVIENYIANSTRKEFQKPDLSKLTKTMGKETFIEIMDYLDNADKYNEIKANGIKSIDETIHLTDKYNEKTFNFTDEEFEILKNFIEKQPEINASDMIDINQKREYSDTTKEYEKNTVNQYKIKSYIAHSTPTSDNVKKPDIPKGFVGKLINDLNGGRPEIALQFLTGATSAKSKFVSEDSNSELLTKEAFGKYKDTTRVSVNFFENHPERGIFGHHEYYIKSIEGNKIVLGDSHDSTRVHTVTVKEIQKWTANLTPTDLSTMDV